MTSKTFKSSITEGKQLEVDAGTDELVVRTKFVGEYTASVDSIAIANTDAPALALAILEAAGAHKDSQDFLGGAVEQLKFHIGEQERITAEARERAELEAEALELVNAWRAEGGEKLLERWDAEEGDMIQSKPFWLAVARRARELAKEATK